MSSAHVFWEGSRTVLLPGLLCVPLILCRGCNLFPHGIFNQCLYLDTLCMRSHILPHLVSLCGNSYYSPFHPDRLGNLSYRIHDVILFGLCFMIFYFREIPLALLLWVSTGLYFLSSITLLLVSRTLLAFPLALQDRIWGNLTYPLLFFLFYTYTKIKI